MGVLTVLISFLRKMGVLIAFLWNSMSRVLFDVDSASSIHTIYAYLTGLLLALVELKYEALDTSPFNDHPAVMILFLIAIILHVMALFFWGSNHPINAMMIWVCHICGILSCEMLLLLLLSPMWCFIINLSPLLLLFTFLLCYHFFFKEEGEARTDPAQSEEGQATQGTETVVTVDNP